MNPFRVPPRNDEEQQRLPRAHLFKLHVNAPFAHFVTFAVWAAVLLVLAK